MAVESIPIPDGWESERPAGTSGYVFTKRLIDVAIALISLPFVIPVIAIAWVAIVIDSPGWPAYRQWRAGRDGKLFKLWKLRTMVPNADQLGPQLTEDHDPRITRVGTFLRRWSIDEWPQVINVLAGQMSLVGPRAELPSIVRTYTAPQLEVLKVKPGVTGWSQIHGRDDLSIPEKLALDREYVYGRSLGMDGRILIRTIPLVLSGRGIKR